MFGLIKKENGNVQAISSVFNRYFPANCFIRVLGDEIRIFSIAGFELFTFKYSDLAYYRIEPSAVENPPPADINVFVDTVLMVDFFFDSVGFSGIVEESLSLESFVSATLTGTTNNLTVAGLNDAAWLYLTPTGGLVLTGILAPVPVKRQMLWVTNIGTVSISTPEESVSSDPANRFIMQGTTATLAPQQTFVYIYDTLSSRWRLVQTL